MSGKWNGIITISVIVCFIFILSFPVLAKSIAIDTNADSKPDRWEYYDQGELVRIEADTNDDGTVDEWAKVDDSQIVSAQKDSDYDGEADSSMEY